MFGYDPLNYGRFFNVSQAESIRFNAGTEATADYTGEVYTITPNSKVSYYVTKTSPSGNTQQYGNSSMTLADSVQTVINSIPTGSYYRISGFPADSGVANSPVAQTPKEDCASQNREENADGTCGDCLSGYVLDESTGEKLCVAETNGQGNGQDDTTQGTNWALIGGVGVAGFILFTMLKK